MSRGLWFIAGTGAGVYAMVRGRRAAEAFTPDGLRDRVGAAVVGMRMFRDEVAQGRAETEPQVRRQLGLVSDGAPELSSAGSSGVGSTLRAASSLGSSGQAGSTSTDGPTARDGSTTSEQKEEQD